MKQFAILSLLGLLASTGLTAPSHGHEKNLHTLSKRTFDNASVIANSSLAERHVFSRGTSENATMATDSSIVKRRTSKFSKRVSQNEKRTHHIAKPLPFHDGLKAANVSATAKHAGKHVSHHSLKGSSTAANSSSSTASKHIRNISKRTFQNVTSIQNISSAESGAVNGPLQTGNYLVTSIYQERLAVGSASGAQGSPLILLRPSARYLLRVEQTGYNTYTILDRGIPLGINGERVILGGAPVTWRITPDGRQDAYAVQTENLAWRIDEVAPFSPVFVSPLIIPLIYPPVYPPQVLFKFTPLQD